MKSPEQFEEQIREQRIIEATKRGYMGKNSKLHLILFTLGERIVGMDEGGSLVDNTPASYYLGDPYEENIESSTNADELMRRMPTMDVYDNLGSPIDIPYSEEWSHDPERIGYTTSEIGQIFDGLSRGMHLELKYDNDTNSLTVIYKGYLVYRETKGELLTYVPAPEWEKWIDQLVKVAKRKNKELKIETIQKDAAEIQRSKLNWWNRLKKKWGV